MPRRAAAAMLAAHQPKESAMASRPLGAAAIIAGKAKQRRIVITEANIYVLEGDFRGTTKSKGEIASLSAG
jgi:hypothetical protein